jgi:hypothetical protein
MTYALVQSSPHAAMKMRLTRQMVQGAMIDVETLAWQEMQWRIERLFEGQLFLPDPSNYVQQKIYLEYFLGELVETHPYRRWDILELRLEVETP